MAAITPLDFLDQLLLRMSFPMTFDVARVREVALCVILLTYTDHKFRWLQKTKYMIDFTFNTYNTLLLREENSWINLYFNHYLLSLSYLYPSVIIPPR